MIKKIFALLCLIGSVSASAETQNFTGASVALGVNASSNQSDSKELFNYTNLYAGNPDAAGTGTVALNSNSQIKATPIVAINYRFPLSGNFLLGVIGGIDLSNTTRTDNSSAYVFPNPNNRTDVPTNYALTTKIESKTHWHVGLEPSYVLSENLLGYLKLSYHEMKADIRTSSSMLRTNIRPDLVLTDPSSSTTFRGVGFGIGGTYQLSQSIFIQPELEWVRYNSKTVNSSGFKSTQDEMTLTQTQTLRPNIISLGILLGYKF